MCWVDGDAEGWLCKPQDLTTRWVKGQRQLVKQLSPPKPRLLHQAPRDVCRTQGVPSVLVIV